MEGMATGLAAQYDNGLTQRRWEIRTARRRMVQGTCRTTPFARGAILLEEDPSSPQEQAGG